jgi:hypothetical protein
MLAGRPGGKSLGAEGDIVHVRAIAQECVHSWFVAGIGPVSGLPAVRMAARALRQQQNQGDDPDGDDAGGAEAAEIEPPFACGFISMSAQ